MTTNNKLKNQHKHVDLTSINKEFKKFELNNFTEDNLKNRINALLVRGKNIDKPNRGSPSYLLKGNLHVLQHKLTLVLMFMNWNYWKPQSLL